MIFYRSLANPTGTDRPLSAIRALCVGALTLYPAGALLQLFGPDTLAVQVSGWLLILAALCCAGMVVSTRVSRITAEESKLLDEYERDLRAATLASSYAVLAAVALLGILYLALASDFGWWVPSGYDQWNGVFWGLFLTANMLPPTVLAFRLSDDDEQERRP